MDGFKNSTKTKYMCGGPVKKAGGGGVFNERGKRATNAETAAEGRRMEGRKPPVEGISTRPTDDSGRRMTDAELGLTAPAKKPMVAKPAAKMPKVMSDLERARMMTRPLARKEGGSVPAHSDRPLIRRSKGGLSAMPKGKC